MIFCLLPEFCIKVKNKVCCIIICYCEIKLKKWEKVYWKIEDRHPGKMMLIHDINDNILIFRPYYLGVYQDESKNEIGSSMYP